MELLLPLLLLIAIGVPMYFGVRRQKKELHKTVELQASLKVGDRVQTTSGIQGVIVEIEDSTIDLEIAVDVITTWSKLAIREVLVDEDDVLDDSVLDDSVLDDSVDAPKAEETAEETETRLTKE